MCQKIYLPFYEKLSPMYYNRHNQRGFGDPKKYSPVKEKKGITVKKKVTGELELFKAIWAVRKHVSHFSGEVIQDFAPLHFMHVLSKAKNQYPHFKLYPKNIVLGTEDEHYLHHNVARSDWPEPFRKEIERLESELKSEYQQKHPTK